MIDYSPWVPILEAFAKPTRFPRFNELTVDGEWKDWTQTPLLADEEPKSVEQPHQTYVWREAGDPRNYNTQNKPELEVYTGGLHRDPLEHRHIRLIDLQNVKFEHNMLSGFRIITCSLDDAPAFDALSYCWGDMRLCTGIVFDTGEDMDLVERMFRITEDLATCLVSILKTQSLENKPRYLWIDQICINQEDITERNAQVQLMTDVYSAADQVLVWLGQRSDFHPHHAKLPLDPAPETDIDGESLLKWIAENSVFARQWFARLWTFQEVVLAKRIQVLVGVTSRKWDELADRAEKLHAQTEASMRVVTMDVLVSKLNVQVLEYVRRCREAIGRDELIDLQTLVPLIVRTKECRDPRDKIYGLIGLDYKSAARKKIEARLRGDAESGDGNKQDDVPKEGHVSADDKHFQEKNENLDLLNIENLDIQDEFPAHYSPKHATFLIEPLPPNYIDYRKTPSTVFRDFAHLMISTRLNLSYLTIYDHSSTSWYTQYPPTPQQSHGLLSTQHPSHPYSASLSRRHIPTSTPDSSTLLIRGRLVDTITHTLSPLPRDMNSFFHAPSSVLPLSHLCRTAWPHVSRVYPRSSSPGARAREASGAFNTSFVLAVLDTLLCSEHERTKSSPISVEGLDYERVYTLLFVLLRLSEELGQFEESVREDGERVRRAMTRRARMTMVGRRLVVLDSGRLALVQEGVETGDKVAVVHGLDVPCVLRRVGKEGWRWMGDAFAKEMMHGEVCEWEEEDAREFVLVE